MSERERAKGEERERAKGEERERAKGEERERAKGEERERAKGEERPAPPLRGRRAPPLLVLGWRPSDWYAPVARLERLCKGEGGFIEEACSKAEADENDWAGAVSALEQHACEQATRLGEGDR